MDKKSIMFDLDGVLVDLHSSLERIVVETYPKFSCERILTYDFNKSLDFSKVSDLFLDSDVFPSMRDTFFGLNAPVDYIKSELSNLRVFKEALYFDGVVELLQSLSEFYNIVFHSYAYTCDIAQYKTDMIYRDFGGKFNFSVVTSVGIKKPALYGMDYVIEDNLFDLEEYLGCPNVNLCIIDRPYNSELFNPNLSSVFEESVRYKNIQSCLQDLLKKGRESCSM